MTRYAIGTPAEQAFDISFQGALKIEEREDAVFLLSKVRGLDDLSIRFACKLVGYDVCARVGIIGYKNADGDIHADEKTVFNIRIMVNRSLAFFEQYGPIINKGFTFKLGYTPTVTFAIIDVLHFRYSFNT